MTVLAKKNNGRLLMEMSVMLTFSYFKLFQKLCCLVKDMLCHFSIIILICTSKNGNSDDADFIKFVHGDYRRRTIARRWNREGVRGRRTQHG